MSVQAVRECAVILDRLSDLYPEQPGWHDMALRLRDELSRSQPAGTTSAPAAERMLATTQSCGCCRRRPMANETGMCAECAALYKAVTARAIAERCDCGHEPAGAVVFVYQGADHGSALCGLDCVARHWRDVFAFFIRRSSCEA